MKEISGVFEPRLVPCEPNNRVFRFSPLQRALRLLWRGIVPWETECVKYQRSMRPWCIHRPMHFYKYQELCVYVCLTPNMYSVEQPLYPITPYCFIAEAWLSVCQVSLAAVCRISWHVILLFTFYQVQDKYWHVAVGCGVCLYLLLPAWFPSADLYT